MGEEEEEKKVVTIPAGMTFVESGLTGELVQEKAPDYSYRQAAFDAAAGKGDLTEEPPSTVTTEKVEEKPEEVSTESVETTPQHNYLADYSSDSNLMEISRKTGKPLRDVLLDYQRWGNETGNLTSWVIADTMHDRDISKTAEEIEKEEKRAKQKEKWDAVGNFLMHLGNFVGAAGWGGAVKLEDPVAMTERQRQLRQATLDRRNARNKDLWSMMAKEKADLYNQRRLELESRKQERLDVDLKLRVRRQDWLEKYQQGLLDEKYERLRIIEDYNNKRISLLERNLAIKELDNMVRQMNAKTQRMNAETRAGGSTITITKPDGYGGTTTETRVTTPIGSSRNRSGSGNASGTATGRGTASKTDYSKYKVNK